MTTVQSKLTVCSLCMSVAFPPDRLHFYSADEWSRLIAQALWQNHSNSSYCIRATRWRLDWISGTGGLHATL